jgi:peptide/nickel transport system substrate-binding protein
MKIRQGVKWHNVAPVSGRPMDMDDVIFSWERFATKYSGRSGIVNAVNPDAPVLSLQAVDSRTISIRLKEPLSYILGLFAAPGAYFGNYLMAPKETDTTVDLRGTMIGTGPLMMTNYTPSVGFTLKRHPDHWDQERILVDQVDKPIISEYAAARDQFKAGNMYTFGSHPTSFGVNQEDVLSLKQDEPRISVFQTDLKASGGPGVMSLGWLPEGRSPFVDERVRQAFSMAIDRDLFIDVFSNVSKFRSEGIPVDTRWSTALSTAFTALSEGWWLDPKDGDFGPNAKFFQHDVEEAKKLMAAAGYANGLQTTFHFPPPSILPYAKPAEVIGGMTSEVGIRANFHELDYQKEYIPQYRDGKGQFEGVGFVTNAGGFSGGHPIGYIAIEYWSKGGAAFRGFSASGKNDQSGDPQVETMIEKARLERDTEKAKALVSDLQRYLAKSMYAINGLGAATELTVAWPCVGNYRVYSGNHVTHFYRQWLDQTKPPFTTA